MTRIATPSRFGRRAAFGVAALAATFVAFTGTAQATASTVTSSCDASYSVSASWPGGWIALVTVEAGSTKVNNWQVGMALPSSTQVVDASNAQLTVVSPTPAATTRPAPKVTAAPTATPKVNATVNTGFSQGFNTQGFNTQGFNTQGFNTQGFNTAFTNGFTGTGVNNQLAAGASTTFTVLGSGPSTPSSVVCIAR